MKIAPNPATHMSRKDPPNARIQIMRESVKEKNNLADCPWVDCGFGGLSSLAMLSRTSTVGPIRNDVVKICIHCNQFPKVKVRTRFDRVGLSFADIEISERQE